MDKVLKYLKSLIESNSKESSKRFLALYTVLILCTAIVFTYTNSENVVMVLVQLLSFAALLLGIAAYQKVKTK